MKKKNNDKDEQVKEEQDYLALWDKYLRLQAEFDNYRKRSFKERAEFIKFANEGLIIELLSILDGFERGVKSAEHKKDYELLHQGVDMILKQLHSLLETKGLSRIKCLGQKFDPHQHEAMEVIDGEDVEEETVVDELQPGYLFEGRIIRPAKVKVARVKESIKEEIINEEIEEEGKEEEKEESKEEEKEENKQDIANKEKGEETEEGKKEEKEIGDDIG